MSRSFALKIVWTGLVTWAIPLALSFAFYGRDGQPLVPLATFKSIMFIAGSAVGLWMLALVFKKGPPVPHAGWIVGLAWLAINVLLDLAVLVGGMGMGIGTYFTTIGLGYLTIPIMTVAVDRIVRRSLRVLDGSGRAGGLPP
jgi:hypothetical protein